MDYFEIKDKEELLSKYVSDYSRLKKIIDGLNKELIDFVPDIKDAWSIREHIAHLVDVEVRAFVRYRNSIVDKGIDLKLEGGDDFGPINLRMILSISTQHVDKHIEYLFRNIKLFRNTT